MPMSPEQIHRFQQFFETLTAHSVTGFRELADPRVRYRDPLMDHQGIDAVVGAMQKWFVDLQDIRFRMTDHAQAGEVLYQHWFMNFRIAKLPKREWTLDGMSRVVLTPEGKVLDQMDYWDATPLWESIPLLGRAIGLSRRLMG